MKLEEAKKVINDFIKYAEPLFFVLESDEIYANLKKIEIEALETVIAELHAMQNLLDEKNEEIELLQKEKEKYKNKIIFLDDEEYRKVIDNAQKDCVSKDKIRKKIEEITDKYNRIYKFPRPKVEETTEGQLIYKIRFNTDSEALRIVKAILEELLGGE